MTPEQAYEWLAPKLSTPERQALDVIYAAAGAMQQTHPLGYIDATGLDFLRNEGRAMVWRDPGDRTIPFFTAAAKKRK